jgi:hypothetical protein
MTLLPAADFLSAFLVLLGVFLIAIVLPSLLVSWASDADAGDTHILQKLKVFARLQMRSPIPLFSHHLYCAPEPVGCVPPVCLHGALSRAGIPSANCFDYRVVLGPGCCNGIEEEGDVHPDVSLGLRFHGGVQRAKPGAGASFDVAAVKFLVELVELARLSATG